jgi:hypothetical protein
MSWSCIVREKLTFFFDSLMNLYKNIHLDIIERELLPNQVLCSQMVSKQKLKE